MGVTPRNYRQWLPPPSPNRHCFGRLAQMRAEGLLRTATQSMISGNRGNNGLGPVIIRCRPDATRQRASARTAAGDGMGRTFQERMCKAGFGGSAAVENAGAGYYTLADAFSGRRDSAPHRANMLNRGVTHMGIAAAYAPCGAMVSLEVILPRPAKQELHPGQRQMVWHTTLSPRPCSIAPAWLSVDSVDKASPGGESIGIYSCQDAACLG